MITADIKTGLGLIKESLKWADDFSKESFPRDVLKNYRRQMKTIQEALSENCSAAAYGESQVGKSYLMSSLLSSPSAPFVLVHHEDASRARSYQEGLRYRDGFGCSQ